MNRNTYAAKYYQDNKIINKLKWQFPPDWKPNVIKCPKCETQVEEQKIHDHMMENHKGTVITFD